MRIKKLMSERVVLFISFLWPLMGNCDTCALFTCWASFEQFMITLGM